MPGRRNTEHETAVGYGCMVVVLLSGVFWLLLLAVGIKWAFGYLIGG